MISKEITLFPTFPRGKELVFNFPLGGKGKGVKTIKNENIHQILIFFTLIFN
jgi:hypothetical protein